ncbi:hypothetical protein ACEQPO_04680 [Bacillus sp. SL00103]
MFFLLIQYRADQLFVSRFIGEINNSRFINFFKCHQGKFDFTKLNAVAIR